ncbi:hypothetical protein ACAW74_05025 [Fibrella sp. WM1]|uniref:hypothetical protein n=1 Tax=Fibrella musci TaxID=3242485 RepID=UPI003522CFDF
MKMIIRLEFKDVFPDEEIQSIDSYLASVNNEDIVRISAHIIAGVSHLEKWSNWEWLLNGTWFSEKNKDFATKLYRKIKLLDFKNGSINETTHSFVSKIDSLYFLEYALGLNINTNNRTVRPEEAEINLFKALLLVNRDQNVKHNSGYSKISESDLDAGVQFFTPISVAEREFMDDSPFLIYYTLTAQLAKALYCFQFFSESNKEILNVFYEKYSCKDFNEYINAFSRIINWIFINQNYSDGFSPVVFEIDDSMIGFMENFIISSTIYDDIDFIALRTRPIIKYDDKSYMVVYDLFVIQKIYNGLYFELKEIYDLIGERKKPLFRQYFTTEFSEKFLLYNVMQSIYSKRSYIQFSGTEIEKYTLGGADYYIRNGNKVFLFENKDIFISGKVKTSYSMKNIASTIDEKLVNVKGLPQIINNIKMILNGIYKFDIGLKQSKCIIYPILVIHDSSLNAVGINTYLNNKFKSMLYKMENEGYDIKKIKSLTVINIDTLIILRDAISSKRIILETAIDEYNKYLKKAKSKLNNNKFTISQIGSYEYASAVSFDDFLLTVYVKDNKISISNEMKKWFKNSFLIDYNKIDRNN